MEIAISSNYDRKKLILVLNGPAEYKQLIKFGMSFVRAVSILIGHFSKLLGHILTVQAELIYWYGYGFYRALTNLGDL